MQTEERKRFDVKRVIFGGFLVVSLISMVTFSLLEKYDELDWDFYHAALMICAVIFCMMLFAMEYLWALIYPLLIGGWWLILYWDWIDTGSMYDDDFLKYLIVLGGTFLAVGHTSFPSICAWYKRTDELRKREEVDKSEVRKLEFRNMKTTTYFTLFHLTLISLGLGILAPDQADEDVHYALFFSLVALFFLIGCTLAMYDYMWSGVTFSMCYWTQVIIWIAYAMGLLIPLLADDEAANWYWGLCGANGETFIAVFLGVTIFLESVWIVFTSCLCSLERIRWFLFHTTSMLGAFIVFVGRASDNFDRDSSTIRWIGRSVSWLFYLSMVTPFIDYLWPMGNTCTKKSSSYSGLVPEPQPTSY